MVIPLSPDDYSYELLQQSMLAEERGSWAKQGAYAAAWKFLIYVIVMKAISESGWFDLKRGPAAQIYNYLRDNHTNFNVNPIGILISYLKRLEGVKVGNIEGSIKARKLQQLYRLEEIEPLLEPLNDVASGRPVIVLVDELDRGWDASEDAVAFVAGLFTAAVSINAKTPNIRVLVSLRKELYDNIPALYEDAQKVRDIIEEVTWDEDSLLRIIAQRIKASVPGTESLPDMDAWNMIFADTLDYRKNKSFNYVVDRTLYRPREIIQFCIDSQSAANKLKTDAPLNYDTLSIAEHAYSSERSKDIASEYRFQYPDLLSVFETFRGGPYAFPREDLEFHCLQISTGDLPISGRAQTWALDSDPDDMMDILWRIGFLRAQAVGGLKAKQRSGSQYLGPHQIRDLNLRAIPRFHIHPLFRAFLGLKESKSN